MPGQRSAHREWSQHTVGGVRDQEEGSTYRRKTLQLGEESVHRGRSR